MNADQKFFYENAGYSWNPVTETQDEGHTRCARELADAEARGRDAGLSFTWSIDPDADSHDYTKGARYELWQCVCLNAQGKTVAYLGAVDFGRNGSPHSSNYRRVVEAELSQEANA